MIRHKVRGVVVASLFFSVFTSTALKEVMAAEVGAGLVAGSVLSAMEMPPASGKVKAYAHVGLESLSASCFVSFFYAGAKKLVSTMIPTANTTAVSFILGGACAGLSFNYIRSVVHSPLQTFAQRENNYCSDKAFIRSTLAGAALGAGCWALKNIRS